MDTDKHAAWLEQGWKHLLPPGYDIDMWAPGDGEMRYRLVRLGETYFEADDPSMTAVGWREANNMVAWGGIMWARGEFSMWERSRCLRRAAYALLNVGHCSAWVESIIRDAEECPNHDVVAEFVAQVRMDPCDKDGVVRMARALNAYGEALRRRCVEAKDAEAMPALVPLAKRATWEAFEKALKKLGAGRVRDAIAVLKA